MREYNRETQAGLDRIAGSDLSEMEKLIQTYDWVTRRIIELAQREIELARAMSDEELAVKQSIKMNTLKLARGVFQDCYLRASGSRTRLWED